MKHGFFVIVSFSLQLMALSAHALVERPDPAAGEITSARGDEQLRPVQQTDWVAAEVTQRLLAGDTLRTGRYGALSILFTDESQLRMHRNSVLVIKNIAQEPEQESSLQLDLGSLWARATSLLRNVLSPRRLVIQTPTATAGIRGTDWHLQVDDDGASTLTVLTGEAELFNPQGGVIVGPGEVGVAERGKAPTKRVVVDIADRPLMVLEFRPRWFAIRATPAPLRSVASLKQLMASDGAQRPVLERIAAAYDLGRFDEVASLLQKTRQANSAFLQDPQYRFLAGLLSGQRGEFDEAQVNLAAAATELDADRRILAELGLIAVQFSRREYAAAQAALDTLARANPTNADVGIMQVAATFFRGEHSAALDLARSGEALHSHDPRFAAMISALSFVEGDTGTMRDAFQRALELDPDNALALHAKASYFHAVEPDPQRAIANYNAARDSYPSAENWNNLGLIFTDLGDFDAARDAFERGLELDADSSLVQANYALLMILLDRLEEAGERYQRILADDPGHPEALLGAALLDINAGRFDSAIDTALKAIANNPALPGAHGILAAAYYQAGRYPEAVKTIRNAIRLDGNDPVAPLIASIMAQDRFEPGEAIRYAREGLRRARKARSFAVEGLANTQAGTSSLGSAYSSLGLSEWGVYYSNLAFNPYIANEYFFQGLRYSSSRARLGALTQGLILDPMAVSAPNRYYEFYRTPRTDITAQASLTGEDNVNANSQSLTAQGFTRSDPVAWFVNANRSHRDGRSINDDSDATGLLGGVGTRFGDRRNHLHFSFSVTSDETGDPGTGDTPDPDDVNEFDEYTASLAYHRRIAFDNRVLARVAGSRVENKFTNGAPLGTGLDATQFSLINRFGVENARAFYDLGIHLCALEPPCPPLDPDNPFFLVGIPDFGPQIGGTLPEFIDDSIIASLESESDDQAFQFRHLLTLGDAELTYGIESFPSDVSTRTGVIDVEDLGIGEITDLATFDELFLYGNPIEVTDTDSYDITRSVAYLQSRWQHTPELWTEVGVFHRDFDDEFSGIDETQTDPRVGVAWQPSPGHWLRLAAQRELVFLNSYGTLAPVATVGLVTSEDLFAEGGDLQETQLRWDAEWTPRVFTFVSASESELERVQEILGIEFEEKSRLRTATAGLQLWFAERFGFALTHTQRDSENRTDGANQGNELALVPERSSSATLSWIHSSQTVTSLTLRQVGEQYLDAANTETVDTYTSTDFRLSWLSPKRRWSVALAIANLSDEDIDLGNGVSLEQSAVLSVAVNN